jgi:hypothetical protein
MSIKGTHYRVWNAFERKGSGKTEFPDRPELLSILLLFRTEIGITQGQVNWHRKRLNPWGNF